MGLGFGLGVGVANPDPDPHLEDEPAERVAGHVVRAYYEAADVPLLEVGDAARDAGEG